MKYVYGIVPMNGVVYEYDDMAFAAPNNAFEIVRDGDLAAIVSDSTFATLGDLPRGDLMRSLTRHQEAIEELMDHSPVLPVKFGTVLDDEVQVHTLLHIGHEEFRQTVHMLGGCVEFDVAVMWEPGPIFAEIASDPQIVALKTQVEALPPEDRMKASVAVGQYVKRMFEERRNEMRDTLVQELGSVVTKWQLNPLMDDNMVMNVACLVDDVQLSALERAVYALDEQYADQLNFRLIGPLPPYSFATVEVRLVRPENLIAACELLHLSDLNCTPEQVKHAFYQQARLVHPDVTGDDPASKAHFMQLTEAYRLMTDIAQQVPAGPLGIGREPRILVHVGGVSA